MDKRFEAADEYFEPVASGSFEPVEGVSEWDAGFEGDRRIVVTRLGPYLRVYRAPARFRKRFFHQVFDLKIHDWRVTTQTRLLSGYCSMRASLDIRFQATVKYVQEHPEALPDAAAHIVSHHESVVKDAIEKELLRAEDGDWMRTGLERIEALIETAVNETLTCQDIQCRSRCTLETAFKSPDADAGAGVTCTHFQHEQTYLEILRRSHSLRDSRLREMHRQEEDEYSARLKHEERLLAQAKRNEELLKAKQLQETNSLKAEISEQEKRQMEQLESEQRRIARQLEYDKRLKQMQHEAEIEEAERRLAAAGKNDALLRREIELLVLQKQRNALYRQVKDAESGDVGAAPRLIRQSAGSTLDENDVGGEDLAKPT